MAKRTSKSYPPRCLADLKAFLQHQVKQLRHTPHQLQYIMADFLQGARPDWVRRAKCLLGFRYLTKTFMLRQYVKWRWLRNPNCQVIVQSSTRSLAKRFAKAILVSLRQDPMLRHLMPASEAGEYEYNLAGIEPEQGWSLQCAGIKTSLTGSRADVYIFDDPEPDKDPEALHDRILRAFEEARFILHPVDRWLQHFRDASGDKKLKTVPVPERTQLIVVGQPHTELTAYLPAPPGMDEPAGHPLADAAYLRVPAVGQNGWWLWPECYYSPHLGRIATPDEVSHGFTRRTWRLQMLLITAPMEVGEVLDLTALKRESKSVAAPVMIVDPADGGRAEWGIAIGGMVGTKLHVLELTGFRGEAYEGDDDDTRGESCWAQVFDLAEDLGVREVAIEKNLKAARVACRRYVSKRKVRAMVTEYSSSQNKHRRIIESLEQPINNGMVSIEPHLMADARNLEQFTGLGYARLPEPNDRIDALARLVSRFLEAPGLAAFRLATAAKKGEHHVSGSFARLKITRTPYERTRRLRVRT